MIEAVAVSLNRLPTAKINSPGTAGARKADEASPQVAKRDAGSDSKLDFACRSRAMADKAYLQIIALLLLLATLSVVGAAFAVRDQLASGQLQIGAGLTAVRAGPPAAVGW